MKYDNKSKKGDNKREKIEILIVNAPVTIIFTLAHKEIGKSFPMIQRIE
jgi:hypothetical protein